MTLTDPAQSTHRLELVDIQKEYEGKPLLKGISLQASTGETLCLLGRSGSGKSTLLRIIAGIETADKGTVFWDGHDLTQTPTHLRHFGLMFQDYALFPHRNVAENVAFGLQMQGTPKAEIKKKVTEALVQVKLEGFENRSVTDLSGGEQQRVALARALAPSPRLLMLDEPLAALDRALREQLQEELRELLHQTRIPAIYVTHDQEEALALGDQLAILNDGQIVQSGKPEEVFRWPCSQWVAQFLGLENILKARVISTLPLTVSSSLGQFHAVTHPGKVLSIGDITTIVMTPEDVSVDSENQQENHLRVKVEECTFRGEHYRLKVLGPDGSSLTFFSPSREKLGVEITIHFAAKNVVCLQE